MKNLSAGGVIYPPPQSIWRRHDTERRKVTVNRRKGFSYAKVKFVISLSAEER